MPKTLDYEAIYLECKQFGVKEVARRLGRTYQQLVAEIHAAGVGGDAGLPTRREILKRCEEVRDGWTEVVRQHRYATARTRNM